MALTASISCPYCHASVAVFDCVYVSKDHNSKPRWITAKCPACLGCVVLKIINNARDLSSDTISSRLSGDVLQHDLAYEVFPHPKGIEIPEHVPENVARLYKQAMRNFNSPGNEETAAMAFRKALENAVKHLDPLPLANPTLYKRIELLHQQGKLTDDIKEWAHIIRDAGNDGVHNEVPPTRAELEELAEFTKVFLMYVFTLPAMVAKKRGTAT